MARLVVMGVAGAGKTTIGEALAARLGARFVEADSAHPAANIAKMSAGTPLTDEDRWPWLARLRAELRSGADVVVTCSALKRAYRDLLRGAAGVRFVYLALDEATAEQRAATRQGHFMGAGMVASQFAALEAPAAYETDIIVVDATIEVDALVTSILAQLQLGQQVRPAAALLAEGGPDREIGSEELAGLVQAIARDHILGTGARRVLLVPPDHTRLHSGAGAITAQLYGVLRAAGCEVGVLPALGTHAPMTAADVAMLFGPSLPPEAILVHDWRGGLRHLGELSAAEVGVVSQDRYAEPIAVALDEHLFEGWDLVVSVGQVLPHEVIGMANFTKNLVIGLGGAPTIHRTHFVGAVCDLEAIMGRAATPVRDLVDAAFDRFVAPLVPVLWVLTVMQATAAGVIQRGLFVGRGGSAASGGAAFDAAAELAALVNIEVVEPPFTRVSCWLDPSEFRTTWLGNKAIYRTRMAIAEGGELIVLAPGVRRFGEDDVVDALIRRHGYRGTPATLAALHDDAELAANLGAAAHLVHGSTEGRFTVVYCTDPDRGGLSRAEVEAAGYRWRSLPEELDLLRVDAATASGPHRDRVGEAFHHLANPALGLWATAAAFAAR